MNIYDVLGVASDASSTDIKKAYAVKVKSVKPDVDAEGFRRLHSAYKTALANLKRRGNSTRFDGKDEFFTTARQSVQPQTQPKPEKEPQAQITESQRQAHTEVKPKQQATEPPTSSIIETQQPPAEAKKQIVTPPPRPPASQARQSEWVTNPRIVVEEITEKARDCLEQQKGYENLSAWEFIGEDKRLDDFWIKRELSSRLFRVLVEHNQTHPTKEVKAKVIRYLDPIFNWTNMPELLERYESSHHIDKILNHAPEDVEVALKNHIFLAKDVVSVPDGDAQLLFRRGCSAAVDFYVAYQLGAAFEWFFSFMPFAAESHTPNAYGFGTYLVLCLIMQAASTQGSPGQILLGLRVVYKDGRPLGPGFAVLRVIALALNLVTIQFSWLWNAITMWQGGQLAHDGLTTTTVISRL